MSSRKLIIIGAGGHGKVVYDVAENTKKYDEIYFLDDNLKPCQFYKSKIIDTTEYISKYIKEYGFIVAIGNNKIRNEKQALLNQLNAKVVTLIDKTAIISDSAIIGEGTVVMPKVIVNADVSVGNGVILNSGCVVEHDSNLGNFCHISPNATICGTVSIGSRTWIGASATIINNISVCSDVIVGAGSIVLNNINSIGTWIGVIK